MQATAGLRALEGDAFDKILQAVTISQLKSLLIVKYNIPAKNIIHKSMLIDPFWFHTL
jgi:hypothetical protein